MSSKLITDTYKQVKSRDLPAKNKKQTDVTSNRDVRKTVDKLDGEQFLADIEVLRDFDLQTEYGPCIGITRLERWERAERFGLSPPKEVKDIIETNKNDERYAQCVWNDYNI